MDNSSGENNLPPVPGMKPPTTSRGRPPVGIILAVVGVCLLGGCLTLFKSGSQSVSAAKVYTGDFLTDLEKSDYPGAKKLMSPQVTATPEDISDIMALLKKKRGKAISHSGPKGFYVGTYNGTTQVRLSYVEKFEKGDIPVQVTAIKSGDHWEIYSFNFQI